MIAFPEVEAFLRDIQVSWRDVQEDPDFSARPAGVH